MRGIKNYYQDGTDKEVVNYRPTGYYANFSITEKANMKYFSLLEEIMNNPNDDNIRINAAKKLLQGYGLDFNEEVIVKRFKSDWERVTDFLENTFSPAFKSFNNKGYVPLYRVVRADTKADINQEKPGNHWVLNINDLDTCAMFCQDCDGRHFFSMCAATDPEDINWRRTVWTNFFDGDGIGEVNTVPNFKPTDISVWQDDDLEDCI